MQLAIGVFVYGEPMPPARLAGFAIVWVALAVFTVDGAAGRTAADPGRPAGSCPRTRTGRAVTPAPDARPAPPLARPHPTGPTPGGPSADEQRRRPRPPARGRQAPRPLPRWSQPAGAAPPRADVLAFERQWWRYAGAKETAIREQFGLSATRYYQVLNTVIDRPEALAVDPLLVRRLRRMRATRQRQRSARHPGQRGLRPTRLGHRGEAWSIGR